MKQLKKEFKKISLKSSDVKAKSGFWQKPKDAKQFALTKIGCKKGQMGFDIMIGLLVAFITITLLIALLPAFVEMLGIGMNSQGLNCKGTDADSSGVIGDNVLDYNATIGEKSTIGCLGMKLYLPYIVLGILLAIVGKILYSRNSQPMYQ